jgi:Zn-dependent protease with chaperone function
MTLKTGFMGVSLCLWCLTAMGQFDSNYTPIRVLDTIPQAIHDSLTRKLSKNKSIDRSAQVRKLVNKLTADRNEKIIKLYNDGYFMTEGEIAGYLNSILEVIQTANPEIPRDIHLFPYRSEEPNALSFGEGTIGVMLGLLSRLEREEDLAFVICHEIAHYTHDHVNKGILEYARINYDKAVAQQIQQIKVNEYQRYSNLKKLLDNLGLTISRHSRVHEFEADSIGYLYYRNTPYANRSPVRLLEVLDSVDIPEDRQALDLKDYFNFQDYPFKQNWLAYMRSNIQYKKPGSSEFGDSDTTHTHPDCKRRILAIKRIEQKLGSPPSVLSNLDQSLHTRVRAISAFEVVKSTYDFKKYGLSLFKILQLQKKYPKNIYLQAMCGRTLYYLYLSQKNHQFGKHVQLQNPFNEENYDRFLSFLHSLRLGELGALSYYSVTTQPERFFGDEEFLYTFWLVSDLPLSKFSRVSIRDAYLKEYPYGTHVQSVRKEKR